MPELKFTSYIKNDRMEFIPLIVIVHLFSLLFMPLGSSTGELPKKDLNIQPERPYFHLTATDLCISTENF